MAVSSVDYSDEYWYMKANSGIHTGSVIQGKDASQMDMSDFMTLLVAQMTNQDMLNPSSDTEFVAQMAQFASLQGIQTLTEYAQASYSTSYAGKYVLIANYDGKEMEKIRGLVERVSFYDGQPQVVVDGKSYPLYTVMEVASSLDGLSVEKSDDEEGDGDGDEDIKTGEALFNDSEDTPDT